MRKILGTMAAALGLVGAIAARYSAPRLRVSTLAAVPQGGHKRFNWDFPIGPD